MNRQGAREVKIQKIMPKNQFKKAEEKYKCKSKQICMKQKPKSRASRFHNTLNSKYETSKTNSYQDMSTAKIKLVKQADPKQLDEIL